MPKRGFDIAASILGLMLLTLPFLIIATAIKLDSPGPIFHRAKRVGLEGREFTLFKFRTMVANADQMGPAITASGDPRVTRVGKTLRRTKLDELPQLWNVLRGDMSLVGPRPEDPFYVARYTQEQRDVLKVRPGITSPASLTFRHEESLLDGSDWETRYVEEIMPAKLKLDLEYVRRASIWQDVSILFRTFLALWR